MSAFRIVLGFEVARTLRKRSFWLGALAVPAIVIVIALLQFFATQMAAESTASQEDSEFSFVYLDESGLISADLAAAAGGTPTAAADAGLASVHDGAAEAFFHYPADPIATPIEVVGQHTGIFGDGRYGAVAASLLESSTRDAIGSDRLVSLAQGAFTVQTTTLLPDGQVSTALQALPVGALLFVLFFLIVILLGNPVLIATTEEKENRVAEILLTSARPDAVITAKLVALGVAGLVQMLVVALPVGLGWLLLRDQLQFPGLDLSQITFDPQMILIGLLLLLTASALFIASLAAIGAAAPSAKEAGGFTFAAIFVPLVPLYAIALIVSSPSSGLVQFLTYFPFTAGTTALARNAFGTLSIWEGLLVAGILAVSALIMVQVATRAFRRGALEYDRRLGLREIFAR